MNALPTEVLELLDLAGPACEQAFAEEMDKISANQFKQNLARKGMSLVSGGGRRAKSARKPLDLVGATSKPANLGGIISAAPSPAVTAALGDFGAGAQRLAPPPVPTTSASRPAADVLGASAAAPRPVRKKPQRPAPRSESPPSTQTLSIDEAIAEIDEAIAAADAYQVARGIQQLPPGSADQAASAAMASGGRPRIDLSGATPRAAEPETIGAGMRQMPRDAADIAANQITVGGVARGPAVTGQMRELPPAARQRRQARLEAGRAVRQRRQDVVRALQGDDELRAAFEALPTASRARIKANSNVDNLRENIAEAAQRARRRAASTPADVAGDPAARRARQPTVSEGSAQAEQLLKAETEQARAARRAEQTRSAGPSRPAATETAAAGGAAPRRAAADTPPEIAGKPTASSTAADEAVRTTPASSLSDSELAAITKRVTDGTASEADILAYTSNFDRAEALAGGASRRSSERAVRGTPEGARSRRAPEAPTPTTATAERGASPSGDAASDVRGSTSEARSTRDRIRERAGAARDSAADLGRDAAGVAAGAVGSTVNKARAARDAVTGKIDDTVDAARSSVAGAASAAEDAATMTRDRLAALATAAAGGSREALDQIRAFAGRVSDNPAAFVQSVINPVRDTVETTAQGLRATTDELTAMTQGVSSNMLRSVNKARQTADSLADIDAQIAQAARVEAPVQGTVLRGTRRTPEEMARLDAEYRQAQASLEDLSARRQRALEDFDDQIKTMAPEDQKKIQQLRDRFEQPLTPEFSARLKTDDVYEDVGATRLSPEARQMVQGIMNKLFPTPGVSQQADEAAEGLAEALGKEIDPAYLAAAGGVGLGAGILLGD